MTLDVDLFKLTFCTPDFNIAKCKEYLLTGNVISSGSRTFRWKLFLGVVPEENSPVKWIESIRKERSEFYRKTGELKITKSSKDLDPNFFNPLANNTENNPWNNHFKDKEVRELITQDIERTS